MREAGNNRADQPSASEADAAIEARQHRELRHHRRLAGACLVAAILVYVATQLVDDPAYWVLLVRAGAEAGLIGGIADWFAVVALFRRPLGLPIPHTAILPRNKERLGNGLGRFVSRHFLEPDVVEKRLAELGPAAHLGDWLTDPGNADMVAERLLVLLPDVIQAFDDEEVRGFYADTFEQQVRQIDLLPVVQRLGLMVVEQGQHRQLFDRALLLAARTLDANRDLIYQRVEKKSSWWIPRRFDRKLAEAIVTGVEEWLHDLSDPDHGARVEFDRAAWAFVHGLGVSDAARERLAVWRDRLLESEEVQALIDAAWRDLRNGTLERLDGGGQGLQPSLARALIRFGETLQTDPDARARIDQRINLLIRELVLPFRGGIGAFIADVVRNWDSDGLSRRLELTVGRDLQFIRINGTLVGALVGMVIFIVSGWVF